MTYVALRTESCATLFVEESEPSICLFLRDRAVRFRGGVRGAEQAAADAFGGEISCPIRLVALSASRPGVDESARHTTRQVPSVPDSGCAIVRPATEVTWWRHREFLKKFLELIVHRAAVLTVSQSISLQRGVHCDG